VLRIYNVFEYNDLKPRPQPPTPRGSARLGDGLSDLLRQYGISAKRIGRLVVTAGLLAAAAASAQEAPPADGPPLRFGEVRFVTQPIFSRGEVANASGPVRTLRKVMNGLHVTTRTRVLRREMLFKEGQPYDPRLLEETARNLRGLGYLNDVTVVAADTTVDGRVDVLVTTRESWSLSTSFGYSLASGGEQRWNVKVADTNFLGYGLTVGAGVGADEDRSWWNLWYRKRRLFDRALWLGIDWAETGDGHVRNVLLSRPLFALDDARGIDAGVWDREARLRWYFSNAGPLGLDPTAAASLHGRIHHREKGARLRGLWRLTARGAPRIWRLGGGVRVTDVRWQPGAADELSDGRLADLRGLDAPGSPMARENGLRVFPFAWLQTVGRRWVTDRFVIQYGPQEDIPLDAAFDLKVGPAGGMMGSTSAGGAGALRAEGTAEKWLAWDRSYVLLRAQGTAQAGDPAVRTHAVVGLVGWFAQAGGADAPWLTRVVAEGGHGSRLAGGQALLLGLDRGLRTLDFDGMAGDRLVRWNVEEGKVAPGEVLGLMRLGGAVFYGGGCAWWRDEDRDLGEARHEAGFGLRVGPTRSANNTVARIDLTWDLAGSGSPVLTAVTSGLF